MLNEILKIRKIDYESGYTALFCYMQDEVIWVDANHEPYTHFKANGKVICDEIIWIKGEDK